LKLAILKGPQRGAKEIQKP